MASHSIGIIGYGTVGSRTHQQLDCSASVFDLNGLMNEEAFNASLILLCVPTPSGGPLGLNLAALEQSLEQCSVSSRVVIRSTLPIGGLAYLEQRFERKLHYWPEFGTEDGSYVPNFNLLSHGAPSTLLERIGPCVFAKGGVLEWVKLATNAYFAVQVALANELANQGAPLEAMLGLLALDPRISTSHLNLNGSGGYGGKCLPKDVSALARGPLLKAILDYAVWEVTYQKPARVQ